MKVFMTGSTGYVGNAILKSVIDRGHEVIALQRSKDSEGYLDTKVTPVHGDITDRRSLSGLMNGCDMVIHLVGIIREVPGRGVTMNRVHVEGTRNIVEEAKRAGIKRFLHMSALGARKDAVSAYHKSKWTAEEIVRQSGISYTIFRPSVIFGRGGPGPNFVAQLYDLVRKAPIIPVIGDGSFLLQPVLLTNLSEGFAKALETSHTLGKVYEVGGPEQISYLKILEMIAATLGKPLRKVHVPVAFMKSIVPLMQRFSSFPITTDQLTMLLEGNICRDWESYYRDFEIEPEPFKVVF